jgi:hypothetical protein
MPDESATLGCIVEPIERRNYGRLGVTLAPRAAPRRREVVRRPAAVAVRLVQALAWQEAVEGGEFPSFAALARHEGMAPQRVAQILELTLLAPDIQEAVLFLEAEDGVEPVSERALRGIAADADWSTQRGRWAEAERGLRTRAQEPRGPGGLPMGDELHDEERGPPVMALPSDPSQIGLGGSARRV